MIGASTVIAEDILWKVRMVWRLLRFGGRSVLLGSRINKRSKGVTDAEAERDT
jgi:hypothetical protein